MNTRIYKISHLIMIISKQTKLMRFSLPQFNTNDDDGIYLKLVSNHEHEYLCYDDIKCLDAFVSFSHRLMGFKWSAKAIYFNFKGKGKGKGKGKEELQAKKHHKRV